MATGYTALADEVQQYARQYFSDHPDERLLYHNIKHTEEVAEAVTAIASHYQLDDHDFFVVLAAAWLHDIGYLSGADGHEQRSAGLAGTYLQTKAVDDATISAIQQCILATHMPQQPANLLDQVVCDADLFHLGTDSFTENNKLMRREHIALTGTEISKAAWRKETIELLESHQYHTEYCRLLLGPKKQENLAALKEKAAKPADAGQHQGDPVNATPTVAASTQQKKDRPDRGIETMFRITSTNHQRLSDQADSKSHILITVNSIIISVLLSVLLRSIEEYPHLAIPAYILLGVNLVTIIFAILATRPKIPPGEFTKEDIAGKKVNLLFFGNFYRMSAEEYSAGMRQVMEDRDFLYGSLIKDIYQQGKVLGRKYRLLRVAYDVFMYGLIASVLAFIIASFVAGISS